MTGAGGSTPTPRPVVVELVGLPGAGKSRTAAALAGWLVERGTPVTQPQGPFGPRTPVLARTARKTTAAAAALVREPVLSVRVARGLLRSGQPGAVDTVKRFVQWQVNQRVLAPEAALAGVCLVDEGMVQCLWSIGLRGRVAPLLDVLTTSTRWRAPDLLVVVRTPPDVAAARLARRPSRHSRTQRLPSGLRQAELERGEQLLDGLIDWWEALPPRPRPWCEVAGTASADPDGLERVGRLALSLSAPGSP